MANELELATTQFSTNLMLRLQQQTSRLRGRVMEGAHVGKMAAPVDYLSPVAMQAPGAPFSLLTQTDNQYMRRWVTPTSKNLTQRVDTFQKLQTMIDPTGALTTGAAAAVAREWDDRVIGAAFGTASTGVDEGGLATETWADAQDSLTGSDTGLTVSDEFGNASTTIGLTVDKLIEARRLMRHYHVLDEEMQPGDLTLIIGSTQERDLFKQVEVTSGEFNDTRVLPDGRVTRFLGWDIVISERLNVGADPVSGNSNCRACIAFVKSGLYLGVWQDMINRVTQETLLSGQPWQLYTMMTSGATRLEPGRVIQISCGNDTAGADNI